MKITIGCGTTYLSNKSKRMKKKDKYSDESIERGLNKIFNAGMKNHKLHPDDDSYDVINKQYATKKMFLMITKLRDSADNTKKG